MTILDVQPAVPAAVTATHDGRSEPLLLVVGYDGSEPARAALDVATELIRGRSGHLAIVFVAHVPVTAALSADAVVGIRRSLNDEGQELQSAARTALDDREPRWNFQQRSGLVAEELSAAAAELRRTHGPSASVGIVVGGSLRRHHHMTGSVSVALARAARFPLMVVPQVAQPNPDRDPEHVYG